jgi:small subunit ribosomal protein S13
MYILETEILHTKPLIFSLQSVYGLGKSRSQKICRKLGFSENLTISDLNNYQVVNLVSLIEKSELILNNDLRKVQSLLLQKKINIKAYKGLRCIRGLPVRGQRTHTNARTVKSFYKKYKRD